MAPQASGRKLRKNSDVPSSILFLTPAFLLIICITFVPIVLAFRNSFHATNYAQVGEFVGFENYKTVFKEGGLQNILNSIEYVVLSLVLVMPLGIALGTLLNPPVDGGGDPPGL